MLAGLQTEKTKETEGDIMKTYNLEPGPGFMQKMF